MTATPSKNLEHHIEPYLYKIALQRRVRVPVFDSDLFCAARDDAMDQYGDHALVCSEATAPSGTTYCGIGVLISPLELVYDQKSNDLVYSDGVWTQIAWTDGRRPADVYLPHWHLGGSSALDFAVTSGLRVDVLRDSAADGATATRTYEHFKKTYLNTYEECQANGFVFTPMVFEAHAGSCGAAARKTLKDIGAIAATIWLRVRLEAKHPSAIKNEPISAMPRNVLATGPASTSGNTAA